MVESRHGGAGPFAFVLCGDALGLHLFVGTVGAVRLAHGVEQLFRRHDAGVSAHIVGAAGSRHTAVGAELRVVLNEPDLLWLHMQRLEDLQRDHERADVAALAEFLIGVVLREGAVGVDLESSSGLVGAAFGDVEAAPGESDAAALLRRILLFRFRDRRFVKRLHFLHHLFHRVLAEGIAVDVRVARAADVAPAELERIDAGLLSEHIHEGFAESIGLWRTIAAVSGAEVVVRVRHAAETGHVRNAVREERETGLLRHAVVAAP